MGLGISTGKINLIIEMYWVDTQLRWRCWCTLLFQATAWILQEMLLLDRGNLNRINWEANRLRSCKKIFLEVKDSNIKAKRLYSDFKFNRTGTHLNFYKDEDAAIYELSIDNE